MQTFITTKFQALLDSIVPLLTQKPSRIIAVVPGNQVAWDDCCEGQLTARLVTMTPVYKQSSNLKNCVPQYWNAQGEIMLLRCSQALNDDGSAPTPAVVKVEGVSGLTDTEAIIKGIDAQDWISTVTSWLPQGPSGGCRGVQILFNFVVDNP